MPNSTDRILVWIIVGAIVAAAFVPLYVSQTLFFPFISGKNFAFRILAEVAFAAWLILALRNPAYRPRSSGLLWSVALFVGVLAVATLLAEDPYKSFWSNFERMEGFIGVIHFALFFFVAGLVFRAKEWRTFALASLTVNLIIIGYALLQFFGVLNINQGGVRVDATFGNAIYLGVYALFHSFLAGFVAYRSRAEGKHIAFSYFFAALALANILLVVLSATRGTVLGLFVGALVSSVFLACSRSASPAFRRAGVAGCIFAALAVGGFFAARAVPYLANHPVFGRVLSVSPTNDDAQARFVIWEMSWKGFKERPLFGWGQEGFNFVFNKHYDPRLYRREAWFDRVHNAYFDWLIAGGLFGIAGYLSLWYVAAHSVLRKKNTRLPVVPAHAGQAGGAPSLFDSAERALFIGFGTAYAVNNVFVFDNGVSHFLFFMILAYVHYRSSEYQKMENREHIAQAVLPVAILRIFVPIVVIALTFSIYWFNARPAYAGALLLDALRAHKEGPTENLALFRQALALNTFANAEIREQLVQVTAAVAPISGVPIAVKQEFLSLSASELDKEIKKRPADARYYTFMGSLLDAFGLYEQAFPYWREAVAHSPQKQALLFQTGSNRLNAGKAQEAVSYFKTAYELNPKNRDAVIIYAVSLIYTGDRAEEKRILTTPSYVNESLDDPRLVLAYQANGRVSDAIALLRAQLARDPENPENKIRRQIDELLKKKKQ